MRVGPTERRGACWPGGEKHRSVLILFWFVFSHQGEKMNSNIRTHRHAAPPLMNLKVSLGKQRKEKTKFEGKNQIPNTYRDGMNSPEIHVLKPIRRIVHYTIWNLLKHHICLL